ncbi:MAG TPA: Ig-like domain-containing protein [Patescibacteria group bacterium]|nr:Ig-like domain-containing protein [Patescibacteria group bacterium]
MRSFWDQRIPTLLGIFLIIVGIGVTTYVLQQTTNLFGHAAPSETPSDIRITNVTDSSFTVSYHTDASVIGTLSVGTTNTQTVFDERDEKSGTPKDYHVHSFTVQNLKPQTTYSFSVLSGTTTFLHNGSPFTVATGTTISTNPSGQLPFAGKLINPDGSLPADAIVYVTTAGGQSLSALVRLTGLYLIPLNTMRTKDFASYMVFASNTKLNILATDGINTSQATAFVSDINPVAAMTLSQNYDFTISVQPIASSAAAITPFPVFPVESGVVTPKITTPGKDNQSFTDSQPLFQGTGQPGQTVTIEIHSDSVIKTQVTTNPSGQWSYRPPKPLGPGQHTITIQTANQNGIIQTIQRSFTVFAAGSQVSESATPSATPTVTIPTPTPTFIPTVIPTVTPLPTLTPTPILIPSATPTIHAVFAPSTAKTIPVTGNETPAIIAAGAGVVTTIVGILILVL